MQIEHGICPSDQWDAFAESHPGARLGHASAWASVLSDAYGLESHYLSARDDSGRLRGILPLVSFRSRPGGRRRLISLPYLDGSGILALDAEAADGLLEHALKLVASRRFGGLDLRSSSTAPNQLDGSDEKAGVNLVL